MQSTLETPSPTLHRYVFIVDPQGIELSSIAATEDEAYHACFDQLPEDVQDRVCLLDCVEVLSVDAQWPNSEDSAKKKHIPKSKAIERTYKAGRTTAGWCPMQKVQAVSEISKGDVLISVSHQFKSQNLVKVTLIKNSPTNPGIADKFYVRYCDTKGEVTGTELICVWDFDVAPRDNPSQEFFKAEYGDGKESHKMSSVEASKVDAIVKAARAGIAADITANKTPITWNNTFNSGKVIWGHISEAQECAFRAGYEYLCWNGRVYLAVNLADLDVLEEQVEK